ncbi:hypothetical protein LINGRAHAP2_LOCUS10347 [Linum grandiflorum]
MKSKAGQGQNMLVRMMTSPIRALGRARDFYVNSFTECTTGGNHNSRHYPSSLPRSMSTASSVSSYDGGEDLRELVRAASVRCYGHKNEAEMYVEQAAAKTANVLPKSVSVGMGFMGRIDEDNACEEFDESNAAGAGDNKQVPEKYSRSKSYAPAASKRLPVF